MFEAASQYMHNFINTWIAPNWAGTWLKGGNWSDPWMEAAHGVLPKVGPYNTGQDGTGDAFTLINDTAWRIKNEQLFPEQPIGAASGGPYSLAFDQRVGCPSFDPNRIQY